MNYKKMLGILIGLMLAIGIASCNRQPASLSLPATASFSPSSTATPVLPSPTPSPASTHTPLPSLTPSPSATPTSTPSPTSTLHPMSILAARLTAYPGSAITIEETLEPGSNYSRYIAWYESQGLKIYGLLTIPNGEKPAAGWPAIVFNHGYIDPRVYKSTERYIAYVDLLARSGYVVYRIDYRGHDRSDGVATGAYGDPGYTTDVLNAVSSLEQFPQVDPTRIGVWGHSMGGYLTLRAMVISPDIRAGVIWAGVVGSYPDMICCWHHPEPALPTTTPNPNFRSGWRTRWQELYGTLDENPDFWLGISANHFLSDLSGPIQLHHGTADEEVPIAFSQELYAQLLQAGKVAEYDEYPGDNHNLSRYFNLAMSRTIQFFDQHLKGP